MTTFKRIDYNVEPINYNLTFTPDFKEFEFDGHLVLECNIKSPTKKIILNSKELSYSEAFCDDLKGFISLEPDQDLLIITFDSPISEGKHLLKIEFKGTHNDKMSGFYRSKYQLQDGTELWNLCTQFESTFARMAFPCIDEPDRKATFDITMIVPDKLTALSNMPEISREPMGEAVVKVKFDRSPIMSTYLVAMVVGNFEFIEGKDTDGIPIRVYAPIGKKECGTFALEVAEKCLPFYKDCFGIGYALPKLDLIAIPDFSMGAMENWGLVTFREILVLIDPNQSSVEWRVRVARCVAHELAHMWFGNLVTMEWWTHLWLNEGFARLMEFVSNDFNYKEFKLWSLFANEVQSMAFSLDGLRSSHPIEVPVQSPDQIDEIFDTISYAKGASVLNMLKNFIGEEKFFKGLKVYMNRFKYTNTKTEDLWQAFSESSGVNIGEMLKDWTSKTGYPFLEVSKTLNNLKFKQQKYMSDGVLDQPSYWIIPLKISKVDDDTQLEKMVLPRDGDEHLIKCPQSMFRINPNRSTFVRIKYDENMHQMMFQLIKENKINEIDRLAYIDDYWKLAFAGHYNIRDVVAATKELYVDEKSYFVWDSIKKNIFHFLDLLNEYNFEKSSKSKEMCQKYIHDLVFHLIKPTFERLGWNSKPEDSLNDKVLRPSIIEALGLCGHEAIILEAKNRFDAHYIKCTSEESSSTEQLIDPDLRLSVYKIVMKNYSKEVFEKLCKLFTVAKMNDEKVRISYALGNCQDSQDRQNLIQFTLSDDVRKQDRYLIMAIISLSRPEGRRDMWEFIKKNIKTLHESLGTVKLMGRTIHASLEKFASMKFYQEAVDFFKTNKVDCEMTIKQGLEHIIINCKQLERMEPFIQENMAS